MSTAETTNGAQIDGGRLAPRPDPRDGKPLGGYLALIVSYASATTGALVAAKRQKRLPERLRTDDLVLVSIATQRVSRLLTKDRVTTVVRAPFTELQDDGGPGEVEETPREGTGLRRAIGELLVCPFCIAQWTATSFAVGLLFAPRVTRFMAGVLSAVTVADLLQLLYRGSERAARE